MRVSGILVGLLALSLAIASTVIAAPFAYVSNSGSNAVWVIDGVTNTVLATVPVGPSPSAVSVNSKGTRAYVVNAGNSTISVIDTASNTVVQTVNLVDGTLPMGIAVRPDGTKVYVANGDGTVQVLNNDSSGNLSLGVSITAGGALGGIAVASNNPALLYATDFVSGGVVAIDTTTTPATLTPIVVSSDGRMGSGIAVSDTHVYVPWGRLVSDNEFDLEVAVIARATNTFVSIPVGTQGVNSGGDPNGVTVSGNRLYVAVSAENTVAVIDTTSNTVVGGVPVGAGPVGVASDPAGTKVFVGNADAVPGTVSVITTANNQIQATITVGSSPSVIGLFVADVQPPSPQPTPEPPPPAPAPSCEAKIAGLEKQVGKLGRQHGPAWVKAALYARAAAMDELELAKKKVGDKDKRYVRAMKEIKKGDKALCVGHYWRAKHEFWDAFDIAHKILRQHRNHRR